MAIAASFCDDMRSETPVKRGAHGDIDLSCCCPLFLSHHHFTWDGQRKVTLKIKRRNRWTGTKLRGEQTNICAKDNSEGSGSLEKRPFGPESRSPRSKMAGSNDLGTPLP